MTAINLGSAYYRVGKKVETGIKYVPIVMIDFGATELALLVVPVVVQSRSSIKQSIDNGLNNEENHVNEEVKILERAA